METKLKAEKRDDTGKGVARKLRAAGRVPGVLYGHGLDPVKLSVDARDMTHLLHGAAGGNALVDLVVDGQDHLAMAREIQRDHIHNTLIHVDFLAVSRTEKITVNVPVIEIGEAVGVREGGVVEHHLREVSVECFPQDVPEQIEIDITDIELGGMVHVSDLTPPDGVTILSNLEDAVLSVVTPAALRVEADLSVPGEEGVVPAEAAEEEGAEPAAEGEAPAAEGEAAPSEAPAEEGGEA
jgi:large subunit ribosomal protein L25